MNLESRFRKALISLKVACMFNYFSADKAKPLCLEETWEILCHIKLNLMLGMIGLYNRMKGRLNRSKEHLTIELAKYLKKYEQKALKIFNVQLSVFKVSIEKYQENSLIFENQIEMLDMLERTSEGLPVQFQVSEQIIKLFPLEKLVEINKQDNIRHLLSFYDKINKKIEENQNFILQSQEQYFEIIFESLNEKERTKLLIEHGFLEDWGYPPEIYVKIMKIEEKRKPQLQVQLNQSNQLLSDCFRQAIYHPKITDKIKLEKNLRNIFFQKAEINENLERNCDKKEEDEEGEGSCNIF